MIVLPTDVFPNYIFETVDLVDGVFIPLTDLPGLTATEANATTGDGREVLRVLTTKAAANLSTMPSTPTGLSFLSDTPVRNAQQLQEVTFTFEVNIAPESYVLPSQSA